MPSDLFEIESLCSPLDGDAPSGPELGYDAQFIELEQASAGKPERQYGDTIFAAEPPDWPQVYALALALARRTRDLRIGLWLTRAGTRLHGLAGAARGLELLAALLTRLWPSVHPQLDASESNDPTMRLNALAGLAMPDAFLADLRTAAVAPVRGSLTLRELELGLGRADPGPDEAQPTETGVLKALAGLLAAHPGLPGTADAAVQAVAQISRTLEEHVNSAQAPDLGPLARLVAVADDALRHAGGGPERTDTLVRAVDTNDGPGSGPVAIGGVRSRADIVRQLEQLCVWIETQEPSNPAPLLIRRAQRLMDKSFIDLIKDLAPDGLGQVEHIAGPAAGH